MVPLLPKIPTSFSFLAPSGFSRAPKDSHASSSPWSVFQDGAIGGISSGRGRPLVTEVGAPFSMYESSPGPARRGLRKAHPPTGVCPGEAQPAPTGLGAPRRLSSEKRGGAPRPTADDEFPPNSFSSK